MIFEVFHLFFFLLTLLVPSSIIMVLFSMSLLNSSPSHVSPGEDVSTLKAWLSAASLEGATSRSNVDLPMEGPPL